jgi:hypothetical protein
MGIGIQGGSTALDWVQAHVRTADAQLQLLGHRLETVDLQTMLAVHALLVASAVALALARRRWTTLLAALCVLGCSPVWLAVNQQWEGRVLIKVSSTHGITQADLTVPAVIGVALMVRWLRYLGRATLRRRAERRAAGVPSVFRIMWPKFD